ncbi:aminopeptidase N-like [Diachasmimorpha longicaudata]|uniref:aminopeptidase N-like n=1 Tax=Diachasmimorpha longicaudata TaxID=58733 RepID=UPI0030B8A6C9
MAVIKALSLLVLIISAVRQSSSCTPTTSENPLITEVDEYRLPNNTLPRLYTLNLEPHIDDEQFSFDGTSNIIFEVLDPTWNVTLHASILIRIDETYTTLVHSNGTIEKPISQSYNVHLEFFNLQFSDLLDLGNYTIKLKWKGHPGDKIGLYRTAEEDKEGKIEYMLANHFEPSTARAAFPCWDEPALKAEFEISLKHHPNYTALSNMPITEETTTDDGKVLTSFQRTPVMSTYLVTCILAPYTGRSSDYGNITFWAPSDKVSSASTYLEFSPKIVSEFENYTGIPYALPKLDGVYVPEFSAAASENWGLISYARFVLVDPTTHTYEAQRAAILLATHEIAHQWFGNLVTPAWWSDVWLSEAFAVYMARKILTNIIPNDYAMDLYVVKGIHGRAFTTPKISKYPIRWIPHSPRESMQLFSPVTYEKGGAVVRMLEHIVTEEVFHDGIRKYLNKYQFSSVETNDLWRSLQESYDDTEESSPLNIQEIMNPWLEQTGYPLLTVVRNYTTGIVNITQTDATDPTSGNLWTIPINYATTSRPDFSSTRPTHFISPTEPSLLLDDIDINDAIILNNQQTGLYRVDYDWENWKRIIAYLNSENYHKIHVLNRAHLLKDLIHFSETDNRYYELLIDLAMYLRRETNVLPWMLIEEVVNQFRIFSANSTTFDYKNVTLHIMENVLHDIELKAPALKDENLDNYASNALVKMACYLGHKGCKALVSSFNFRYKSTVDKVFLVLWEIVSSMPTNLDIKMVNKFVSWLIVIFLGISRSLAYNSTEYETPLMEIVTGYRLPNNTFPRLYILQLEPHIDDQEFTFDGSSSTLIEVLESTWIITFHASTLIEINKTSTALVYSNGTIEKPISQRYNSDEQFFIIRFNRLLEIGNYTLKLKWRGYNAPDLQGFYRAIDRNQHGEMQYMVATHFEPLAARAAFPCWDEPAFKAEFEISLKHAKKYLAISNMPIKSQVPTEDEKMWTIFHRSPVMSTYLATFVLAPYKALTNEHGNMSFFVPSDKLQFATTVFKLNDKIVNALENYTGIAYSLPKLDAVYVPQYSSAATEHWGLIAYWRIIFVDPDVATHQQLISAVLLATHELTHQWFGNLVTPAWWSDLWLSEAFAVHMANKIADDIIPNFHAMDLFAIETGNDESFPAAEWSSHPIRWMPNTRHEIRTMFSSVTYRKGAAVVRMLEHMITEEVFLHGIRKYIYKHQFGSAVTNDLWQDLQESYDKQEIHTRQNLTGIMNPWLEQTGYPLVRVIRDYKTRFIGITQSDAGNRESGNIWTIPINYATTSRPDFSCTRPTHFLQSANESIMIDEMEENDWIILNIQQTGFYRVDYDSENWKRISAYLNSENYHKIHVLNRAQLLHDVLYFAERDARYYELLMDMAMYLRRETNYLPWTAISKAINRFALRLMNTSAFDFLKSFILQIMSNIVDHIGFEDRPFVDDNLVHLARVELLPWACAFGHEGCKAVAPTKLMEILNGKMKKSFRIEHRGWIYCTALAQANETVWDLVMNAHWANSLEDRPFKYLGCTKNHRLIKKYLTEAFAENTTASSTDVYEGLNSMTMGSAENYNFALDYFIENTDQIRQYLTERNSTHEIGNLCLQFAELTKTLDQLDRLTKLLNKLKEGGKRNNARQLIDIARASIRNSEKFSSIFSSIKEKPYFLNFIQN